MSANERPALPAHTRGVPFSARLLGWAGLLPFLALSIGMLLLPAEASIAAGLLAHYAFGILCFLLGTWWGIGVMRPDPSPLLWSNALFVVLFFARALLHGAYFMVAAALLFVLLLLLERRLPAFRRQPAYYVALRTRLSLVAAAALMLGAWQYPG
jgi:hypothetical protein